MSRTSEPKKKETRVIRQIDAGMVVASHGAVDRAMKRAHDRNPAKYHLGRPKQRRCSFDPACPFTQSATE